jgi:murein DD-endopeptidase MepM/ murein hydrolase activator NlpD
VLVKDGEAVRRGQPIGIEGWTGAAGHRHLHWSVQKLPGVNQQQWEERIAWDGESVPFQFTAVKDGKLRLIDSSTLKCAHAGIGAAPASEQPAFMAEP